MGRPKLTINWKKVDKLLQAGATGTSIADIIGVKVDTLYKRCKVERKMTFSEYSQTKRAIGLDLVRVKQFDLAMGGDKTMLVWLGKQHLNQSDKGEAKVIIKDDFAEQHDLRKLNKEQLRTLKALFAITKKVK